MYAADVRHKNAALAEKLAHIYTLRGGPTIDLTIRQAYLDLLEKLGTPHERLPPVIHVAGTNGKGSTIAFLKAILNAAGYSVHTYTSPHLYQFNERITLADRPIDDTTLESLLDEVMAINNGKDLTFFEVTTAMAFLAFSRAKADIILLETGLGGRLDCTNVIENPLATIITSIGFDHTEFLGDTIAAIAGEKAGIIKPNRPCILATQTHDEVAQVIASRANALNAPLLKAATQWPATLPAPALMGAHQFDNAQNALAAVPILKENGFNITQEAIAKGLKTAKWAARLQKLDTDAPYELWYDGGHNENAARILAVQAAAWQEQDNKPLYLVIAMMRTKDPAVFVNHLKPFISGVYTVAIPNEAASYPAQTLADILTEAGIDNCTAIESITVLKEQNIPQDARILICGSLYLAPYLTI